MSEKSFFFDIDCFQQKKHGQNAFGDCFKSKRFTDEGRLLAVLSDGLGSGIKANILATMTATMILKFIEDGKDILKATEVIMNSLPVCQVRKISYSTFSAFECSDEGEIKIVEEGNPDFIHIRSGRIVEHTPRIVTSKKFTNRHMHLYNFKLEPEDRLIFCSDGVTQAGMGTDEYKLGWRREGLIEFVEAEIKRDPSISSRHLAMEIVKESIRKEPDHQSKDDVSALVLYFRQPRKLLIFTGPPYRQDRDAEYSKIFDDFDGRKAIVGGTTANLIARELGREITTEKYNKGMLPACSHMDGVDLITEGILTLTKVLEYLNEGYDRWPDDAAGRLIELLLDSDVINFMIGSKLNQAHYDPDLPLELEIRKNVVKQLEKILSGRYIKKVNLKFI